ncbi:hypothetical protein TNCT_676251 [Trichonephila clavata]|uniref:Uncharacterized protein n=1 Tax=Trichonephila clavata TaxID=2740835 RepID=A0A8X6KZ93_TRICU|nr:hypothetical protein TNCT_676251 [Trichonephila clavata]
MKREEKHGRAVDFNLEASNCEQRHPMNRSLQKGKQRFGRESLMDLATHTRFSTNAGDAKEHFFISYIGMLKNLDGCLVAAREQQVLTCDKPIEWSRSADE